MVMRTMEEIVERLTNPRTDIGGGLNPAESAERDINIVMSILMQRVEDAIMGDKKRLVEFANLASSVFDTMLRLDPEVRDAVLDADGDASLKRAYLLGQLEFLTNVLNNSVNHRAEDTFIPKLTSEPMLTISKKLLENDYEGLPLIGLLEELNMNEEAVRAAIREMVHMGAADFRYTGQKANYFLTHTGAAVIKQQLAGE